MSPGVHDLNDEMTDADPRLTRAQRNRFLWIVAAFVAVSIGVLIFGHAGQQRNDGFPPPGQETPGPSHGY